MKTKSINTSKYSPVDTGKWELAICSQDIAIIQQTIGYELNRH